MDETPAGSRDALHRAAEALAPCRRLLVLCGAGLSADAGVPTFRDCQGRARDPRNQHLATREAFQADPEAVWEWYRQRREQIAGCQPHAGQRALALLQHHLPAPATVLVATTNEDDLLERAGLEEVVHLHGMLFDTACARGCGWSARDDLDNARSFLDCPRCGSLVRPASVWFGEPLDAAVLERLGTFDPDGCLVVGSSGLVQPIASIPPELALAGRPVVEVNPALTPLGQLEGVIAWRSDAITALPALVDLLTSAVVQAQRAGVE